MYINKDRHKKVDTNLKLYQPSVPLLQDAVARMEILSECTSITSTLFSPEEERDESAHDITVDFSLDTSANFSISLLPLLNQILELQITHVIWTLIHKCQLIL